MTVNQCTLTTILHVDYSSRTEATKPLYSKKGSKKRPNRLYMPTIKIYIVHDHLDIIKLREFDLIILELLSIVFWYNFFFSNPKRNKL
jgi:hypothetical protein